MSSPVSISVPSCPSPETLMATRLVVQVATAKVAGTNRYDHSAPAWQTQPAAVVIQHSWRTGAEPSTVDILIPRSLSRFASENTPEMIPPVPDGPDSGDDPSRAFWVDGFPMMQLIRVVADNTSPQGGSGGSWAGYDVGPANPREVGNDVVFIGDVVSWEWDLAQENIILHCADFRHRMRAMHYYGIEYAYGDGAGLLTLVLTAHKAIFNKDGYPNRLVWCDAKGVTGRYEHSVRFCPENYHSDHVAGDGQSYADWWSLGDILECLRRHFSDTEGFGASIGYMSYDAPGGHQFLAWPYMAPGTGFYLAADPDAPSEPIQTGSREMDLSGADLCSCLDALCVRAAQNAEQHGCWDWTLLPLPGDAALARLEIFNGADPHAPKQKLYLPEPGESVVAMPRKDICGGKLTLDGRPYRNRIVGLGSKKVVQVSFSTVAGTLMPQWKSAEQAAYIAEAEVADQNDKRYPTVFLEWAVPRGLDWLNALFDGGEGAGGGHLISTGIPLTVAQFLFYARREFRDRLVLGPENLPEIEDIKARLNCQVFRSTDDGDNWEELPAGVQVTLQPDRPVVRLAPIVRAQTGALAEGEIPLPWSWDGSAYPHDILLTVALEGDDLLSILDDAPAAEQPREAIHDGEGHYAYESIFESRQVERNIQGAPAASYTIRGDTDTSNPPDGFPDAQVVVDDSARLAAAVRRRAAQLGQYPIDGAIELVGFIRRFRPGSVVSVILTSKEGNSSRGPYPVNAVVRQVDHVFGETWRTTLHVQGLPR